MIKSLQTYVQLYKHVHTHQLDQNRRTEKHFCMKTETLETNHKNMYDHFIDLTTFEVSFTFMGLIEKILSRSGPGHLNVNSISIARSISNLTETWTWNL